QEFAKAGYPISPRIAITAADLLARCGPDCLTFVADFNVKKDLLSETIKKFKSIYEIKDLEILLKGLQNECNKEEDTDKAEAILKNMEVNLRKLASIKADDSIVGTTSSMITKFNQFVTDKRKDLKLLSKLQDI